MDEKEEFREEKKGEVEEWLLRSFVYGCHLVRRSLVHQAKMILK